MYTIEYIRWLLCGPDTDKAMHLGIVAKDKLMGFIAGTTMKASIHGETMKVAEVNLMTVHSKLRGKRLTPILIQEIQRRFNLAGVWQGMYADSRTIPGQYATN